MLRFMGILFTLLLIEVPIFVLDHFIANGFLNSFLQNQSLQIMGTALAINIATSAFLAGELASIEAIAKKELFEPTRGEMKQNLLLMVCLLIVQLALQVAMPVRQAKPIQVVVVLTEVDRFVSLFIFLLYIFALYEMTVSIFSITRIMIGRKPTSH